MSLSSGTPGRGLNFFSNCEVACNKVSLLVVTTASEPSWRSLKRLVHRDLELLHQLPLQTLNDRLKRLAFVDPSPFDDLLTEMIEAVHDWIQSVTRPYWLPEALEQVVALGAKTSRGPTSARAYEDDDELELEQLARFEYQIPMKLRELQVMVRPFLEVRSSHYIEGVDAITSELVRGLLHIHQIVKAWEGFLIRQLQALAQAGFGNTRAAFEGRVSALAELCSAAEMSDFEVSHRLHRLNPNAFAISDREIAEVCRRLPALKEQRLFLGSLTSGLEHGKRAGSTTAVRPERIEGNEDPWGLPGVKESRREALDWWRWQGFASAVPSRILASSLLDHLVQHQLHPDPWVAEMLPRVLDRLFGVQISCEMFMNRLLLKLGGYSSAGGVEVLPGSGLLLLSDVTRAAETLLVFLRQWADAVQAAEEEEAAPKKMTFKEQAVKRASKFVMHTFLDKVNMSGHSVDEVVELLEGSTPIPDNTLKVKVGDRRYRVDEATEISWELLNKTNYDLMEPLEVSYRDLGPYVQLDVEDQNRMAKAWGGLYRDDAPFLFNEELVRASEEKYTIEDSDEEEGPEAAFFELRDKDDVSDFFGLRLIEAPEELLAQSCPSAFMRFLREPGQLMSRSCLPGLPALPWCLGSDPRNTLVLDLPQGAGLPLAPFQCVLVKSKSQVQRVSIVPLHGDSAQSYIVCPKYQPMQVRNGDRLVCPDWVFELKVEPDLDTRTSKLFILTEQGTCYEAPAEGCHIGVSERSRRRPYQPAIPSAKLVLTERTQNMAEVHLALRYDQPMDRWTVVDHSPDQMGLLLEMKTGTAYPLSRGLRIKLGPLLLEATLSGSADQEDDED